MGDERVTVRSLDVVKIDAEKNLLLVKGPVPGANDGYLYIRPATRLFKRKAKKLAKK
jgi:large subunit ribosomal protein L3